MPLFLCCSYSFRVVLPVAVFFCSHASNALEIAVKGCRFGETKHIGGFLKCLCGSCVNEALGLCRYVLLYPFAWRDAIGGSADRFTEIFWCKVEYICIELDLSRLPIVFYHQLAEAVEDVCMSVDYPSAVLIAAVVIEKLMLTACLSPCDPKLKENSNPPNDEPEFFCINNSREA